MYLLQPILRIYFNFSLYIFLCSFEDALKVRHKAFNTKSGELLIDLEGDPIPSNSDLTLESLGI
ncbi:uncharacterized protein DC041_0001987, partial [Schistosoma bovis]